MGVVLNRLWIDGTDLRFSDKNKRADRRIFSACASVSRQGRGSAGDGAEGMPLDTWEENPPRSSASFACAYRILLYASARIANRSMLPNRFLILAHQRPMTDGVQFALLISNENLGDPRFARTRQSASIGRP